MSEIISTPSFKLAIYAKGDKNAKKLALVLPGRLDTKDYPSMRSHVDFLADRGFYALSFDPPGTWESPGGIELYTMTNYLKAINELIEYFGDKPTFAMGHSRGGSMAMLAGTTNPLVRQFAAVMSHIMPRDAEAGYRALGKVISYRDIPNDSANKKKFELPNSYFEDVAKFTMSGNLKNCTKPKLFFLGLKDVLVKPDEVREIYKNSAEPKEIHELNSDHDYRRRPEIIEEVNKVVGEFLDKYETP